MNSCRDSQILVYFSLFLGSFIVCSRPLERSSCGLNRLSLGWFFFSVQRVLIERIGFLGSSIFLKRRHSVRGDYLLNLDLGTVFGCSGTFVHTYHERERDDVVSHIPVRRLRQS